MRSILDLPAQLYDLGCIQFGSFTLKSGVVSPVYVDLRRLVSGPKTLLDVVHFMMDEIDIKKLAFDRIAGVPYAGLPIATTLAIETFRPMVYPRPVKEHGTKQAIEGNYKAGEIALLVDDLITRGDSKLEAIAVLEAAGLKVADVLVLIDREQGGVADLANRGYKLHTLMTLRSVLLELLKSRRISGEQHKEVTDYLDGFSTNVHATSP